MVIKQIQLLEHIRVKIKNSTQLKQGIDAWRVIVHFISDYPEQDKLIKEYFIWVTGEYLEDKADLSADIDSAEKFALDYAKKRFVESGNQVPVENGVSCSMQEGVVIVDPKNYIHPAEKNG